MKGFFNATLSGTVLMFYSTNCACFRSLSVQIAFLQGTKLGQLDFTFVSVTLKCKRVPMSVLCRNDQEKQEGNSAFFLYSTSPYSSFKSIKAFLNKFIMSVSVKERVYLKGLHQRKWLKRNVQDMLDYVLSTFHQKIRLMYWNNGNSSVIDDVF